MTCQRSKSRLKKKGKITKYDDPSTKVVYNSTTKYVFVIIWLQFLPKFSKNQSTRNNNRGASETTPWNVGKETNKK